VPSFFTDAIQNLWKMWYAAIAQWHALSSPTRFLVAILIVALTIHGASRSETSGMSMILFFCAFAFFAYVVTLGYGMIR
jgi:hypothetical protein